MPSSTARVAGALPYKGGHVAAAVHAVPRLDNSAAIARFATNWGTPGGYRGQGQNEPKMFFRISKSDEKQTENKPKQTQAGAAAGFP
jgi:hypothetical protein